MNKPRRHDLSDKGAIILGGAHGSLEITRSLGRRGIRVWLITADNPLPGLSRYVERTLSWPGPGSDDALRFLAEICGRDALTGWVLLPGSDEDVRFVAQNHAALTAQFTLVTPAWDKLRWAADKRLMNLRAAELGIAYPHSFYPKTREDLSRIDLSFPVILKPTARDDRNRFADAKAWRADDLAALVSRYDKAKSLIGADRIMIQEMIPGGGTTQFSYAAVWHGGRPIASLTAQRCRQYPIDFGFTSTLVETVRRPEIEAAASKFLSALDFTGLVEIEFKYDTRDGTYKILDVNPRAWTWLGLGAAAGIDFAALQWQLACGESVAPAEARTGAQWRYLSRDIAALLAETIAGRMSPLGYVKGLHRSSAFAVFAWDDPWPAFLDLPLSALRIATRRLARRGRETATALQSAKITP
ncbi:MAG TPA: ATP-grasp domain-containing protein [Xanthobacteraceae bacterium]|jgi:predicted ATP-grasp superfamily ATP-dependent carboligase|nr:ATP-grasp domain-containing protein [Xanthobacteraceae bacterium]